MSYSMSLASNKFGDEIRVRVFSWETPRGQEEGPGGQGAGGGDKHQEAEDGPLQVQVHHAQKWDQGKLDLNESCGKVLISPIPVLLGLAKVFKSLIIM